VNDIASYACAIFCCIIGASIVLPDVWVLLMHTEERGLKKEKKKNLSCNNEAREDIPYHEDEE
jgi:hypothetical protein